MDTIGSAVQRMDESTVRSRLEAGLAHIPAATARVVVVIPDGTRTAPIPMMFRLLCEILAHRVGRLDWLIALGTHSPMSTAAIERLVGMSRAAWTQRWPNVDVHNHLWSDPATFAMVGTLSHADIERLSGGRLSVDVPVKVNRMVVECDHVIVCGPVFPHEVAGFSGGSKYFFPGISGPEVIHVTHWLGALLTSRAIIGVADTPVRQAIEMAAACIPTPRTYICMVVQGEQLAGLFVGDVNSAWTAAARLSSQLHIRWVPHPYHTALAVMPEMYDDLWTGAKGMYKLEPVIADGGEVIIYAPHITEVSYTHGRILDEIGYHVRDYFLAQWEKFRHYPWGVLAHSTHLRGAGTYEHGVERPRIRVTLATGIPRERCEKIGLGWRDPASIRVEEFANREDEGILLVPHAGEILYRLESERPADNAEPSDLFSAAPRRSTASDLP